ncbi:hypothetical protein VSH64_39025 [Amycolatopsis rhabdoformis]|uniref:SLATT domain-containing protein n=1 Tax=Amycolatopsis rhabdoformis TaxID=1448059 RepID=A0ABZ1I2Z5_9PSEU|nr:hypothetical protein [Amycolatopsis rhabdoformis]WSE28768.1 hypothetical protein VSH64_39025 [Amycolatopsis rhabdoformis]
MSDAAPREGRFFPFAQHRTIELDFLDDERPQREAIQYDLAYRRSRRLDGPLWTVATVAVIWLLLSVMNGRAPIPLWVPVAVLVLCAVGIGVVGHRTRRWIPLMRKANEVWGVPVPSFAFDDLALIKGTMQGIDDLFNDVYGYEPEAMRALRQNRKEFTRLDQGLMRQLNDTRRAWAESTEAWHEQARLFHGTAAEIVEFGERLRAQL